MKVTTELRRSFVTAQFQTFGYNLKSSAAWYNRLRLRPAVPACHALHPGRHVIAARSLMALSLHSGWYVC
jgi:hypothetical protein